ncbi:hypothetical protein CCHL11_04592 [Colletotrichum chlorophyti]|uniref:CHRD domain-containing protein n=1 Tax=Colletotrichum chlorophyti TaxID=708187 RepID=A0A1Q8RR77_9PEZI|nr:hypothetical protein CCHL11_04592 [Colletotrichum chlorophyti]
MKFAVVPLVLATAATATPINIIEDVKNIIWYKKGGDHGKSWSSWGNAGPFQFTSTYDVVATPDQVVDSNNTFTGGLAGAIGYFSYGINSRDDVICYNITLVNFQGEYQSPALSATHIHQAKKGRAGPPRPDPKNLLTGFHSIAFPNPVPVPGYQNVRRSIGCLSGPFRTGLNATGTTTDNGEGFTVRQIEEDPEDFFTDVHSSLAVPGAVRGQLSDGVNSECD